MGGLEDVAAMLNKNPGVQASAVAATPPVQGSAYPEESIYFYYGLTSTGKTFSLLSAADSTEGMGGKFALPVKIIDTELRARKKVKKYFPNCPIEVYEPVEVDLNIESPDEFGLVSGVDPSKSLTNVIIKLSEWAQVAGIVVPKGQVKPVNPPRFLVAIDTMSEIWSWTQEAWKRRLAKKNKVDLDTFRLKEQFDWGEITGTYYRIMLLLRNFARFGYPVIITSRANYVPEYVATGAKSLYFRAQKDTDYLADVMLRLTVKESMGGQPAERWGVFEKMGEEKDLPAVQNPTWQKIREMVR